MRTRRAIFLFLIPLVLFSAFNPVLSAPFSKEELRGFLEGMDSYQSSRTVEELIKKAPEVLEEVLLWQDPTNHYGRWNGLSLWCVLAGNGIIDMSKFFEVTVSLLSNVQTHSLKTLVEDERRHLKTIITVFGGKPVFSVPVYKGPQSSVGFFMICLRYLAKHNMIKKRSTLDKMVNQLSTIKDLLAEADSKKDVIAITQLKSFLQALNQHRGDFTEDSFEVVTVFAKNIIAQIEK
jgi:hypothetical protein